jgi:hypothetical protein
MRLGLFFRVGVESGLNARKGRKKYRSASEVTSDQESSTKVFEKQVT